MRKKRMRKSQTRKRATEKRLPFNQNHHQDVPVDERKLLFVTVAPSTPQMSPSSQSFFGAGAGAGLLADCGFW